MNRFKVILILMLCLSFTGCVWNVPYFYHISAFTLKQAFYSATLITLWGALLSYACFRRNSGYFKRLITEILPLTLVIPSLITVMMITVSFGRESAIGNLLAKLFTFKLYGVGGIIVAHLFFYLPYATTQFLAYLEAIPKGEWRLACVYNWSLSKRFQLILRPHMTPPFLKIFLTLFCLCLSSFTIVISLGGGPEATSYALAIYQGLVFSESNMGSFWLMGFSSCLNLFLLYFLSPPKLFSLAPKARDKNLMPHMVHWNKSQNRVIDWCIIGLSLGFFLWPIILYCTHLITMFTLALFWDMELLESLMTSLLIGVGSSLLVFVACIVFMTNTLLGKPGSLNRLLKGHYLIFSIPGFSLSAFIYILFQQAPNTLFFHYGMTILINAIITFPILFFYARARFLDFHNRYARTAVTLNLPKHLTAFRVIVPALSKELTLIIALSFLIALGDLRAAIFANASDLVSLPALIYSYLSKYALHEAYTASALLLAIILSILLIVKKVMHHVTPSS
ncbi:MAG: ABC transporter permease subunit [Alphaproteobacteria bacterium]|nr:ABC transporter permease subunit [Alphaproteobacteria bacterium]